MLFRSWNNATFEITNFSDFDYNIDSETKEIGEKVIKQLSTLSSVSGTRQWNESNNKEKQFDEYTKLIED